MNHQQFIRVFALLACFSICSYNYVHFYAQESPSELPDLELLQKLGLEPGDSTFLFSKQPVKMQQAEALRSEGKLDEAVRTIHSIDGWERAVFPHFALIEIYAEKSNIDSAFSSLNRVLDLIESKPSSSGILWVMGEGPESMRKDPRWGNNVKRMQEAMKAGSKRTEWLNKPTRSPSVDPDDLPSGYTKTLEFARKLFSEGKYDEALKAGYTIKDYNKYITSARLMMEIYDAKGDTQLGYGMLNALIRIVEHNPDRIDLLYELLEGLPNMRKEKRWGVSVAELQTTIVRANGALEGRANSRFEVERKAEALAREGDVKGALAICEKFLREHRSVGML